MEITTTARLALVTAICLGIPAQGWATSLPTPAKTDLVTVYKQAAKNNADIAAARADYQARREVVPQARAGLLVDLCAFAEVLLVLHAHRLLRADCRSEPEGGGRTGAVPERVATRASTSCSLRRP